MLIERACERLVTEYCHFVDHGKAAKISSQFTDDGVWVTNTAVHSGRKAIEAYYQARQANVKRMSRHVCNNLLIDVIDENNAKGVVYLTLYRHDGEPNRPLSPSDVPQMVGEYRDTFVRTARGWRFKRREINASFSKAADSKR